MDDLGLEPVGRTRIADPLSQRLDRELLGELIEDAILALGGRVLQGESHAGHRIADIEEAARLPPLPVDGQRQSERALDAKAVEHRAPDRVVVEPSGEPWVERHFVRVISVDHSLVQIGGTKTPYPAGELT